MKMSSEKERLLRYAGGLFGSMMSNPTLTNIYSSESLMWRALKDASKMIEIIYDDVQLNEVLKS